MRTPRATDCQPRLSKHSAHLQPGTCQSRWSGTVRVAARQSTLHVHGPRTLRRLPRVCSPWVTIISINDCLDQPRLPINSFSLHHGNAIWCRARCKVVRSAGWTLYNETRIREIPFTNHPSCFSVSNVLVEQMFHEEPVCAYLKIVQNQNYTPRL